MHIAVFLHFIYLLNSCLKKNFLQESDLDTEVFDLLDPSSPDVIVGNIAVSCSVEVCGF